MNEDDYRKPPIVYPFLDRMTFTMTNLIKWKSIDKHDDSRPSSKEYRHLMEKLRLTHRRRKDGYL